MGSEVRGEGSAPRHQTGASPRAGFLLTVRKATPPTGSAQGPTGPGQLEGQQQPLGQAQLRASARDPAAPLLFAPVVLAPSPPALGVTPCGRDGEWGGLAGVSPALPPARPQTPLPLNARPQAFPLPQTPIPASHPNLKPPLCTPLPDPSPSSSSPQCQIPISNPTSSPAPFCALLPDPRPAPHPIRHAILCTLLPEPNPSPLLLNPVPQSLPCSTSAPNPIPCTL